MIHDTAKWVSAGADYESPIIFGKILLNSQVKKTKISICGLGFFELYINGKKISKDLFVPAWSDYEPRMNRKLLYPLNDTFGHRVYYMEYNITKNLTEGENEIAVWLGNGWYNQHERNNEGELWYDKPKLAYTIEITDINGGKSYQHSNENLKWKRSPIYFNNVYLGEKWDFNIKKISEVNQVKIVSKPKAPLIKQTCPPDREIRKIIPVQIHSDENLRIYDAGENITGYISCFGKGKIIIRYAEELDKDGNLDFSFSDSGKIQCDEYITDVPRILKPKFSVKGFRYFEVIGETSDIQVIVVHSDITVTSHFESSNETLNWIYNTYIRTQSGNMHYGIVSDCPHRERLGYTGDGQITCNSAMLLLDSKELYRKWIYDIMDCQCPDTGHVQHTAPFYGGGGGPGGWGCAVVVVPYQFYMHYCDLSVLKNCYPHMVKWFRYMQGCMKNDLIVKEEKDGWCLGDWCTPQQIEIPEALVNTYYFIKSMKMMQNIAEILGIDNIKDEVAHQIEASLNAVKSAYCNNDFKPVQGSDAFLIDLELEDKQMLYRLNKKYTEIKGYDTGIFGTYVLTRTLFENGYCDTAFNLLTSKTEDSFSHMMQKGATTFWENWDGSGSHNHPMFGAVTDCLFEYILGIKSLSPGYKKVLIKPNIPSSLHWVKGHITTQSGLIEVQYRENETPCMKITIPDIEAVIKINNEIILLKKGTNFIDINNF